MKSSVLKVTMVKTAVTGVPVRTVMLVASRMERVLVNPVSMVGRVSSRVPRIVMVSTVTALAVAWRPTPYHRATKWMEAAIV